LFSSWPWGSPVWARPSDRGPRAVKDASRTPRQNPRLARLLDPHMDLKSGYPFWAIKNGLMHAFPPLQADLRCDVAIIGGGITGALIADELAAHGHDVGVVDQRDIGWGSTSASTALLQYEIDTHMVDLAKRNGEDDAVLAYQACPAFTPPVPAPAAAGPDERSVRRGGPPRRGRAPQPDRSVGREPEVGLEADEIRGHLDHGAARVDADVPLPREAGQPAADPGGMLVHRGARVGEDAHVAAALPLVSSAHLIAARSPYGSRRPKSWPTVASLLRQI